MDTATINREQHMTNIQSLSPLLSPLLRVALARTALASALLVSTGTALADAEKGRELYIKNGCWQCHGFVGQGGVTGPKLAPDPKPFDFLNVFIRHTNGPMPKYSEKILSKEDLAEIHSYLASIPKGPNFKDIGLLK
jgi:ubiquinol-cytochrome c reductase cytochrome c subunit